jgi:hypothetical protein
VEKTKEQKQREYEKVLRYRRKNKDKVAEWRRRTKQELIAYKGGKCQTCGYNKTQYPSAFTFHHRDPKQKDFAISRKLTSKARAKVEVDKCDLLCVRCHSELHDELEKQRRTT